MGTVIFLVLFLTFPIWYGIIMYRIGRYGLPFEIRRRRMVDRRRPQPTLDDDDTEVFRPA